MKIKAIALGVLVDWVGTIVLAILVAVFVVAIHLSKGGKVESFDRFMYSSLPLMIMLLIVGLVPVAAGGAVTAHIAKERQIWNASLMGFATLVCGIPFSFSLPLWYNIASYSLIIPCAMLGGWIVDARKRGQQSPSPLPRASQPEHSEGEG